MSQTTSTTSPSTETIEYQDEFLTFYPSDESSDGFCCNTYHNILSADETSSSKLELLISEEVYVPPKYYRAAISDDTDESSKFVWYLNYKSTLTYCVDIVDDSCHKASNFTKITIGDKIYYKMLVNVYVDKSFSC